MKTCPTKPIAILLDFDGTMADSLSVLKLAYEHFLIEQGQIPTPEEFGSLNGPPLQKVVEILKRTHSLPGDANQLLNQYERIVDDFFSSVKPAEGVGALLERACLNDCAVGIVTSNRSKRIKNWLSLYGLTGKIKFIVGSEDVKNGKPSSEPYMVALSKLEEVEDFRTSSPIAEHCVAIEDSLSGAISAISAGIYTLLIDPTVVQEGLPYHRVSNLFEASNLFWRNNF